MSTRKKIQAFGRAFLCLAVLLTATPLRAQQVATLARNDPKVTAPKNKGRETPEARSNLSNALQRRRAALVKYLSTVDRASADYAVTARAIEQLDKKIEDLQPAGGRKASPGPLSSAPAASLPNSLTTVKEWDSLPPDAALAPQSTCYPNAPVAVSTMATNAAQRVVSRITAGTAPATAANQVNVLADELLIYATADAVSPPDSAERLSLARVRVIEVREETKRTDKQVGASARAEGTTSAVEKPGIPELLAFAIEHGAVQKEVDGTSLTLSSSPYALVAAANGDNDITYRNNQFLARIGVSANFNIDDQDNVLASAKRSQLAEWSVRARLSKDRSTRSAEFQDFWDQNIRPKIDRVPIALTGLLKKGFTQTPELTTARSNMKGALVQAVTDHFAAGGDTTVAAVAEVILCTIKTGWVDKIQSGDIFVSNETKGAIAGAIRDIVAAELDAPKTLALINDKIAEMNSRMISTFAYSNKREAVGSDYSVLKLLFERNMSEDSKWDANLGLSLYHKPDRTINQQSVRDFTAALSFEFNTSKSRFLMYDLDESQITISFNGRYQRMLENRHMEGKKADIASAQFKLEIPIFAGLTLPFSATYSNATELSRKDRFRANFGITFDADKLLRLSRAALAPTTAP